MGSVIRRVRKRSLGEIRVLRREEYEGLELNAKVELIRSLIPLGLMHVQALLEDEVEELAGRRYAHADGATGTRHGSNPGTVVLGGQRVHIPAVLMHPLTPFGTRDSVPARARIPLTSSTGEARHGRSQQHPHRQRRWLLG